MELIQLINSKIEQMKRYNELTTRIIYDELDDVGEILDQRQDIITVMDGISLDIRRYISEQAIDRREDLNRLLNAEDIANLSGEMLELQNKIREAADIKDDIIKNDKRAFNRVKRQRDQVREKLEEAKKGSQVAHCFTQTAVDITKGSRLNISN